MKTSSQKEADRLWQRIARQTEGTYAYQDVHNLGIAGLRKYIRQRIWTLKKQRENLVAQHPKTYEEYINGK